jgi:antitoxin StbD
MIDAIAAGEAVNASVSISRFNRGQAGKVFQEVNESGFKIVFKNNRPECILLSPQAFEEIKETLEDYRLLVEAEERLKNASERDFVTAEEAMKELGITETVLKAANTDIG